MDKMKEDISVSENRSRMKRRAALMQDKKNKYEKAGESLEEIGRGMIGCGCSLTIFGIILIILVFLPVLMMF